MKARLLVACVGIVSIAVLSVAVPAKAPRTDAGMAVHLLNRLGFGARPGDVDRVMRIGALAYIDEQLRPERIPDAAMPSRLDPLTTLTLSSREIAEQFEAPIRATRPPAGDAAPGTATPDAAKTPAAMNAARDAARPLQELTQAKILRAVYSERQLEEVLVDFWFNHFNVDARKGPTRFLLTEYERDAIRPHVLGRFRDLLEATAKSSAMLFYLDNWMSAGPNTATAAVPRPMIRRRGASPPRDQAKGPASPANNPRMSRGLNENYGRELLELHTLGVDGGYTQQDVTEVARAFTGWTIADPRQGGGYRFAAALHDSGEKRVLGRTIAAGGEADGEAVLDLLAAHPVTARHIATRLAQRFVSDTPPPALVDRVAAEFIRTHGDLRRVMRTLLTSREFLSVDDQRTMVKTPYHFVVSALRATGAAVDDAQPVARSLQELGMPLYQCQPPTGYKDDAGSWVNTGALVVRMNVALAIASGKLPGVRIPDGLEPGALVGPSIGTTTRGTIARAHTPAQAIALALGSPEFQKR